MTHARHILHILSAASFIASGLAFALMGGHRDAPQLAPPSGSTLTMFAESTNPWQQAVDLPHLYLSPQNPLMWLLLIVLWGVVALDAVGQMLDPSDGMPIDGKGGRRIWIWPSLCGSLLLGAIWPWLYGVWPLTAAVAATVALVLALSAARHALRGQRPAVSFLAGWTTGVVSAALAGLAGQMFGLSIGEAAIMAILPGAALGMTVQFHIGPSVGFPAAMIWGFCGLAVTTMGTNPIIALAAIAGISAMAIILVHAAS